MAMGYYCYIKGIECPYATAIGDCLDNIYGDFGLCEMEGEDMPPKDLDSESRRQWCRDYLKPTDNITEWISVHDRMPEERKDFIDVFDSYGRFITTELCSVSDKVVVAMKDCIEGKCLVECDSTKNGEWNEFVQPLYEITHWMPLPKHPDIDCMEGNMLKNNPIMSNEELLNNNMFAQCDTDELLTLWNALRLFYANGYIEDDSALKPYQEKYIEEYSVGFGITTMENNLLQAIAVKFAEQHNP